MIKAIFADLDMTLTVAEKNPDGTPKRAYFPQFNVDAINKLAENGVRLIVNTGRFGPGALNQLNALGFPYDLISSGGSAIRFNNGEILYKLYDLDIDAVKRMFYTVYEITPYVRYQINVKDDYMVLYENNDRSYTQEDVERFKRELEDIHDVNKIVVRTTAAADIKPIEKVIIPMYGQYFNMLESMANNLDVTSIDCHKGTAIHDVMEYYGYSIEEVAGIGDNENDINILKNVSLKFAIASGNDVLKEYADHVVDTFKTAADIILAFNKAEAQKEL